MNETQRPDQHLLIKQVALDAALRLLETKQFKGAQSLQSFDAMINDTIANAKQFEAYLNS